MDEKRLQLGRQAHQAWRVAQGFADDVEFQWHALSDRGKAAWVAAAEKSAQAIPQPDDVRPGLWRHWRGGIYTVLFVGTHHETRLPMLGYVSHTFGGLNFRPVHGWNRATASVSDGIRGCIDEDGWLDWVDPKTGRTVESQGVIGTVRRFVYVGPLPSDTPIKERT